MTDCLWAFLCGCCDGEYCCGCQKYLSVSNGEGAKMLNEYQNEVNDALKPLEEKWRNKMNEYTAD